MIYGFEGFSTADGLPPKERSIAAELVEIYNDHMSGNAEKGRYYDQKVTAGECNLGIALPSDLRNFEMACCWSEKAVTALADRSRFDGFVSESGEAVPELDKIVRDNRLISSYSMAVIDELKHGGILATLSKNDAIGCSVRFHTFETSAARWNGVLQRIDAAMAIIDSKKYPGDITYKPSIINLYTDDATWVITRNQSGWSARRAENGLGRCMASVMRNQPTNAQPLGTSRITRSVRALTRGYIRTMTLATIGLEFATSPQKYLMGVSDAQYDALINEKFAKYIDSIMLGTIDPESGQVPQYGQLAQGTLQPHVDMLRMLSTQFAASTSLSVTDVGVVNDANPTSADALTAQNDKLIRRAEDLNTFNADELREIALMALAISRNQSLSQLSDEDRNVMAHFLPAAMPNMAAMGDWAVKLATADSDFAGTDAFYEMQGFDKPTIARIQAQKRANAAASATDAMVATLFGGSAGNAQIVEPQEDAPTVEDTAATPVEEARTLNGAQTTSLLNVIGQYKDGVLTLSQAVNVVSLSCGISKDDAKAVITGAE